ncbi:hypothetical protein [Thermofilum pendens]|nr:hypothetical protein [Thermofilum pendens]
MKSLVRAEGMTSRTPLSNCRVDVYIEVLEPFISKWMFIELKHIATVLEPKCIHVFNVKRDCEIDVLKKVFGEVRHESVTEELRLAETYDTVIILDPSAPTPLSPEDFRGKTAVVIGGIMGSHPPRRRTREELTSKMRIGAARNIGDGQFTIDGAAYVALEVSRGRRLDEIPVQRGLSLSLKEGIEVVLPYVYPLVGGVPFISKEEELYILTELEEDESSFISEGRAPSIC